MGDSGGPSAPMRFGTELDFGVALDELRWIKSSKGRLEPGDYESIGKRYNFPADLLEKALTKGLSNDDRMIRTSNWFPVCYAWFAQRKQARAALTAANIAYRRAHRRAALHIALLSSFGLYLIGLPFIFHILGDPVQFLYTVVIPFVLFVVGYLTTLTQKIDEKKNEWEKVTLSALTKGYEREVRAVGDLFRGRETDLMVTNYKSIEGEIPEISIFEVDPLPSGVPFAIENPDDSYRQRIAALRKQFRIPE
jgi:hypothetical protein